ncbi:60S ribosomal protein L38 [Blastocladiella emersonii ATCC 22665]|nr:60S ribosomal protein L38 [Blastocladiella emersonii ATCC 22665]
MHPLLVCGHSAEVLDASGGAPKQVSDIKDFLELARRKDAKSAKIKKTGNITKFKLRCSTYLYTLTVKDPLKAKKVKETLPPALKAE